MIVEGIERMWFADSQIQKLHPETAGHAIWPIGIPAGLG
jgi:hypothetical protein